MALRNPSARTSRTSGLPEPTAGGDFDPFFKASDVGNGKEGARGKIQIMGAPVESESEFSDATIPIRSKNKDYALGIKWTGGNYARLYKRFGPNEKKWKGTVDVEVKKFKKKLYVAVV